MGTPMSTMPVPSMLVERIHGEHPARKYAAKGMATKTRAVRPDISHVRDQIAPAIPMARKNRIAVMWSFYSPALSRWVTQVQKNAPVRGAYEGGDSWVRPISNLMPAVSRRRELDHQES